MRVHWAEAGERFPTLGVNAATKYGDRETNREYGILQNLGRTDQQSVRYNARSNAGPNE
jgi:hypothetical protein